MRFSFQFSPDQDRPGNKQYVSFRQSEPYRIEGSTHGHLSHAIKHYEEFDKQGMDQILQTGLDYVKTLSDILLMNTEGEVLLSGIDVHQRLTLNAIHNTFDLINDKMTTNCSLTPEEAHLERHCLTDLRQRYQSLIDSYLLTHEQVHLMSESQIEHHFKTESRLKFKGVYDSQEYTYILDSSDSGLLVLEETEGICTLFRIDKQGNSLDEIRGYFSRQVEVVDAGIRSFLQLP